MGQQSDGGATDRKPAYVWDPQKLAWISTTETESATPKAEETGVEPEAEEAIVEPPRKKGSTETVPEVSSAGITGEAGVLQYRGVWVRLLAFIIDLIAILLISFILGKIFSTIPAAATFGILFVYFFGFWWWRGQTPGKMLTRAQIVKRDGSRIGLVRAFLRFLVYTLYFVLIALLGGSYVGYIIVGILAFLVIALTKNKRGLHDFVAGTVVINTRPRAPQPVEADISDTAEAAEQPSTSEPEASKQD